MTDTNNRNKDDGSHVRKHSYYVFLITVVTAIITFAIAIMTPPLSGPFCTGPCFEYPFKDIASRFPRDYWWMFPAMLLSILFVMFMSCIHEFASPHKKIYSRLGLLLGQMASAILLIDYFIQVSVIQPSLVRGEYDGIALITQYNPHGIFIAMEELGYLIMNIALFCVYPVFSKADKLQRAIRYAFIGSFIVSIGAFIVIASTYGIDREYRFEVIIISIDWIVLIISGILLSVLFKRLARKDDSAHYTA